MDGKELKAHLSRAMINNSGLEQHRPYLGMSQISNCPRRSYYEVVAGREHLNNQMHWYCWTGYLHEAALLKLLESNGAFRGIEVVVAFDARFRGHVDDVLDNEVIEIKSVGWDKFLRIRRDGPVEANVDQIQMYLRHGGWPKAHLIYIARDVPHREWRGLPLWGFDIYPDQERADRLDAKAKHILAAIDAEEPPDCDCGWCRR